MKISAVVTVYNLEAYLKRCVESLLDQTYPDIEIVLVDDGSTDSSGAICDEYARDHKNTTVIHKSNGGLVSAWIAGVYAAAGDYIMFVDGDDWVDPEMVGKLAERLAGIGREVICSDYIIERASSRERKSEYVYQTLPAGDYDRQSIENEVIPILMGNERRPVHFSRCMKLIDRQLITDNIKYCDESIRMAEDSVIMLPVLMDAERIHIMDHRAYYHYELVTSSMIHKYDPGAYDNLLKLYKILGDMIDDKFASDPHMLGVMRQRLDLEFVILLMYVMKNELRNPNAGYRSRIRYICLSEPVSGIVKATPVKIQDRSNKMLYTMIKNPTTFNTMILRMLMNLNDARYR